MTEEKSEHVRNLISLGKERGYLLYDEVNDLLPAEVHSAEEIEDLLAVIQRQGIGIFEDAFSAKAALAVAEPVEIAGAVPHAEAAGEEVDLDLSPGLAAKAEDPVRLYLREMGLVPLLKREGEVAIAKRIERGQLLMLKTISRSPIVLKELLATGKEIRQGTRSVKELIRFDEEELTEQVIDKRTRSILRTIDKIATLYDTAAKQASQLERAPKSKKRAYLRARYQLARTRIEMSLLVRSIEFHAAARKRMIDRIRHTVERLHTLEREAERFERRAETARGDVATEVRQELRSRRTELKENRGIERGQPDGSETRSRRNPARRSRCRAGEEGTDRGQPAPGGFHRQKIHLSRPAVSRFDSGRQYRADEGGGEIRMAPRL